MSAELLNPQPGKASNRLAVIDADVHPQDSLEDFKPYLSQRWWDHLQTYGVRPRSGFLAGANFPKGQPMAARRDSWPKSGGLPGSDLQLMQEQFLDYYDVDYGILNYLQPTGQGIQNNELSVAMAHAINDCHFDRWISRDSRLKSSIIVPYEDGAASAREIERCMAMGGFAQVQYMSRLGELPGKQRYWPIYEAACAFDIPIGIHAFGYSGWPNTSSGWASYYIEEMAEHATSSQALLTSFVVEGVFERFPKLKVVIVEGGMAWLPALCWRLDRNYKRLRSEVPHLKRLPSDYIKEHIWVSTQPIEEPDNPQDLLDVMGWIGFDRILFSSDYPHWDFDDPRHALPAGLDPVARRNILSENARKLYRLP
ncbi:MAG: amidohydrolase [Alphaproteobacteria bacterium]|nr:amidohydrolase [Alphaproteobacteria bacterium]